MASLPKATGFRGMTTQPKCETSIPLALLNISLRQLLLRFLLVTSSDN